MAAPYTAQSRQTRLRFAAEDLLLGKITPGAFESAQGRFAAWAGPNVWPIGSAAWRAYKREVGEAGFGNRSMRRYESKQAYTSENG